MIKPITTFALVLFTIILTTSCESDAFFQVPGGHSKLFAFSEITPTEKLKVSVSTAVGLNTEDEYFYPKQSDAKVILYENGVALENPGFRYIAKEKAFVSQGSFRPQPNVQYGLEVVMKNVEKDLAPIYGETIIPERDSLTSVAVSKTGTDLYRLRINKGDISTAFGSFVVHVKDIDSGGDLADLIVAEIVSRNSGVYLSNEGKTILFNKSRLDGDIVLDMISSSSIEAVHVSVKLNSITADAYHYYKAFSGMQNEQSHLLHEPIIDQSNFQNGLGLFAGYSMSESIFLVD